MALLRRLLGWRDPLGSHEPLPSDEPAVLNALPDQQVSALTFPSYEGLEIDSKAQMIRLLLLLPGQRRDPIRCALTTASMQVSRAPLEHQDRR